MNTRRRAAFTIALVGAIVLTGCMGESTADRNQRHIDAANTVMRTMLQTADIQDAPAGTAAVGTPCAGVTGEDTAEEFATAGGSFEGIDQRFDAGLLDDMIASFGDPETADIETTLADGTPARRVDLVLEIDGITVFTTMTVTDDGVFGGQVRTRC